MIFVSVGTHRQAFNRLLKKIDELVENKRIQNVFGQIGNSTYTPKNFKFIKFMSDTEYEKAIEKSEIIIAHAGAGAIINSLKAKKTLVVVPRLQKFGEHTDNHQIELAKALSKEEVCVSVENIDELEKAILNSKKLKAKKSSEKQSLIKEIDLFLKEST